MCKQQTCVAFKWAYTRVDICAYAQML